jgi:hypothetical protein
MSPTPTPSLLNPGAPIELPSDPRFNLAAILSLLVTVWLIVYGVKHGLIGRDDDKQSRR